MVDKNSSQPTLTTKIVVALFSILFLIALGTLPLLFVFYDLGTTTLSCQRLESNQVNCNNNKSRFFSLIKLPPTSLKEVFQAKFKVETTKAPSGAKEERNFVTLTTLEGEVDTFKGNATEMRELVTQINSFLQSNEPSLIVEHKTRWFWSRKLLPLGIYLIIWEGAIVWIVFSLFAGLGHQNNKIKSR